MITKSYKSNFCALISISLCCWLAVGEAQTNNTEDARYSQALAFSKTKNYEKSIALFKELTNEYPKNISYLSDYIQILADAGKYDDVLALAKQVPVNDVRAYVLEAIARCARNIKQFAQSEYFYRTSIKRFPDRIDAYIGLAFVYVDQGRTQDALNVISPLERQYPNHTEILFATGYIYEMAKDNKLFKALKYYEKVLSIDPKHSYAIKRRIFVISKIGAPSLAYNMAQTYPKGFFSADEMARIRWDKAAYWIRWGQAGNSANETLRFEDTDRAKKEIQQNLAYAKTEGIEKIWDINARFDLILALRDRVQMQELVTEAEKLLAENVHLSPEVMIALGDAYLYLEEPEQAKDWYFAALKESPQSFPLRLSIFYAHLEAEDHSDSVAVIEKLVSEQASVQIKEIAAAVEKLTPEQESTHAKTGEQASIQDKGKTAPVVIRHGNPNKTEAEATFAMSKAYLDDLQTAEEKTKFLSDNAPHNQGLRENLAGVYYLRGWPRRAQEESEIGLNADPKNVNLRIASAKNLLSLKEYREAEKQVTDIYQLYPENLHAQKQYRLWNIHNDPELHVEVNGGETSGAQQKGSRNLVVDTYLYSSPIDYNFRAFAHYNWTKAGFQEEGKGQTHHEGIGIEYTRPDLKLTAEIHHNNYATRTNKIGFSVGGQYDFDDQWSINALYESISAQTPLRALRNNIYAQSVTVGGKFRQHESREINLSGSYLNFSDGNQGYIVNSAYIERWYSGSVYKFTTDINLYYTQNSKPAENTPYFNPKHNFASSITFDNDWLTYRDYDLSWHQNLSFTIGQSWQDLFGNNIVGGIAYQHRWKALDRFELIYGTSYGRYYFDGQKALNWQYSLMLNWRF